MTSVTLGGIREIEVRLNKMPQKAKSILRASTNDLAADMRKDARRFAPRRSGILRKAIKSKPRRGRPNEIRVSLFVEHGPGAKFDAWWWHFVEFGTVHHDKHEYLRPAYDITKKQITQGSYQKKVWERISRAVLR